MTAPPDARRSPARGSAQSSHDASSALESTLVERIEGATDVDLVVLALLLDGDYSGRHVEFRCPCCQASPSGRLGYPAARVVDVLTWSCCACGAEGTLWQLRRLVLETPFMVTILMENLGIEVAG